MLSNQDLEILVKNGKRSNSIYGVAFEHIIKLKYRFVKNELPELLKSGNINVITKEVLKAYNVKIKFFKRLQIHFYRIFGITNKKDIKAKMAFVLWLKDCLEQIYLLEQEYLSSPPDNDLLQAGIRDLDELGETNIIDALAGGDVLKWEAVRELPYNLIFDKQRKSLIESRINKNLSEILKKKNKPNRR